MFKTLLFAILPVVLLAQTPDYTQFVNPLIGTGAHGHTFPGAVVPFGMVQLSPDTRIDGSWDGCGGYHYNDSIIYGFSHTHLSGTGCSDYGDILLMPSAGVTPYLNPKDYASLFRHKYERTAAGYYAVKLDKNNILAELTTTPRTGFHRYSFQKGQLAHIVLDLAHRDETLESELKVVNSMSIEGFRISKAWAARQIVYFSIEFSSPIISGGTQTDTFDLKRGIVFKGSKENPLRAYFSFGKMMKPLLIKVGISAVSIENARLNREKEIPDWDFEHVRAEAKTSWNKELSKIEIKGGTKDQNTIFYSALYHCMIHPSLYTDVNGEYLGRDLKSHKADEHLQYTVFSLWDTFRGLHPLLTLIDSRRTVDFVNTFIRQYKQGGALPVWELSANETNCMIGYHAVPVIADAMVKGLKGFDYEKAYEACKHSAMLDHSGLLAYKANGVISIEDESESVSKTLEYAYDDWCIAQMAHQLGKTDDYKLFTRRAQSYKNVFDESTGYMRPRNNGGWLKPFESREVNNHYTEGNSWQYSFFVPQDIIGLTGLYKGADKLEAKLDELFTAPMQTTGREQADITGLIGQYAHGNEPSHHMAYLYNAVGKAYKTQEKVHFILTNFYKNSPDGLIGNEDCGQMSAWYVLSALGLYCVTPASSIFSIGTPLFPEAIIHLENGKRITLKANGVSDKIFYIQSATLNGKPYHDAFLNWIDLQHKTELIYTMGENPSQAFGADPDDKWLTQIKDNKIVANPVIQATSSKIFRGNVDVAIFSATPDAVVHFTIDGSDPTITSPIYTSFVSFANSGTIKAIAVKNETTSHISTANYHRIPNEWGIKIKSNYNSQYTAGGSDGLIDGLRGSINWRKGDWQGYQDQDFEATIDLKENQTIAEVGAGFLQDAGAWIMMPIYVEFSVSENGITFTKVADIKKNVADTNLTTQIQDFKQSIVPVKARYVKIMAKNYGKLPNWHAGKGEPAFIFVDEVWVK